MNKTILIVEDEKVLRESLAGLLEEEGYDVVQAPNGKEAYDLVVQRPVDLVLSDVRMPEMDGLTLLGHLKQLAPETPVIMIAACAWWMRRFRFGPMEWLWRSLTYLRIYPIRHRA